MTTSILFASGGRFTSGRAPPFIATRRFWISVDSLNRPPTLLTMASSRSSSIIATGLPLVSQNCRDFFDRPLQVVVEDHVAVSAGGLQFALRPLQPRADG